MFLSSPRPPASVLAHLPRLPITEIKALPPITGIYFVITDDRVMYIGQTRNLVRRWANHHRLRQVDALRTFIAWGAVDPAVSSQQLSEMEHFCIGHFRPPLNNTPVERRLVVNTRPVAEQIARLEARLVREIAACEAQQRRIAEHEQQTIRELVAALRWLHGYQHRLAQLTVQREREHEANQARLEALQQSCNAFLPRKP
jgi:hypothetical protein